MAIGRVAGPIASVVLVAGLVLGGGAAVPRAQGPVTFSEHVAPIVFANCTPCHRPGEAAPFPLLGYADVKKRARTVLEVVEKRYMPPWHPEPGFGEFRDCRRLADADIVLLRRWVEGGMPEGDPKKLPPLPRFPEGWQLGQPDLVLEMPAAFEVPARGLLG